MNELLKIIESDVIAGQIYLANGTDWLYRWIGDIVAVNAIIDMLLSDELTTEQETYFTEHVIELYNSPIEPGYRSINEPALCCYAYIFVKMHLICNELNKENRYNEILFYMEENA